MSYRHPRWYDYGKTADDLDRESNCLLVMFALIVLVPIILLALI